MNKLDLQAEIRSLQSYRKEAESLIRKMNSVTEKINESANEEISRIKKIIEKDLKELSLYVSEEIYSTKHISVSEFVEKDKEGNYPTAHFSIQFGYEAYPVDCEKGVAKYKIAIVEDCHSYSAIYADGLWADDFPGIAKMRRFGKNDNGESRNINDVIDILCRNWDAVLDGAYSKIKEAYKKDTEKALKNAVKASENANVRYNRLSAAAKKEEGGN